MEYVIVTTAKNEENYIEFTLNSVIRQTLLPKIWVIVDDCSTDKTSEIICRYSKDYPWIKNVKSTYKSDQRHGGVKLVYIWNMGYDLVKNEQFDFLVRLDADLTLPPNYFEESARCFRQNPDIGLCGGIIVNKMPNGKFVREIVAPYHVRGSFKAYRKECFEAIGGFPEIYNWDGIDGMKVMHLGWKTRTLPLDVIHHRPTSSQTNKGPKFLFEFGREHYKDGNDLIICIFRSAKFSAVQKPILFSGVIFLIGYIYAWLKREKRHVSPELAAFIKRFQHDRILKMLKLRKDHQIALLDSPA